MPQLQIIFRRVRLVLGLSLLFLAGTAARGPGVASAQGDEPDVDEQTVVTSRRSNSLREGPGSFHKVLAVIKKDVPLTVLDRNDGWIRVELPDERTGWIAEVSVRPGPDKAVSPGDIPKKWVKTEATETEVAAAIRGFRMHASTLDDKDVDRLITALRKRPSISPENLEHFRTPLQKPAGRADLELDDLNMDLSTYDPTVKEQRMGFAVAARLAARGLVEAPQVRRYLTLIAEHLTEGTRYYNLSFDVLVLNGEGPDAFACPGGTIFLTRGVFMHFDNEAQLAGLLAHEIGHVIRQHGSAELEKRSVRRRADKAFAELEEATGEGKGKYETVEERLDSLTQKSYERVVNDRLLAYEKEADRIAAALLAESGYAPSGIVNAAQHIAALRSQSPDLFDHDYLEKKNIRERLRRVRSFVQTRASQEGGRRLPQRFQAYAKEVR
ncbi:MAG: M48 family metalloprotease [Salinibacter sp.]